jgi:hypothetical protein
MIHDRRSSGNVIDQHGIVCNAMLQSGKCERAVGLCGGQTILREAIRLNRLYARSLVPENHP